VQHVIAIGCETDDLAEAGVARRVAVIRSSDPWNPVSCVRLYGLTTCGDTMDARIDVRIPIPDLYGYASSASIVLVDRAFALHDDHGLPRLPGLREVDNHMLSTHCESYVAVRESASVLKGTYMAYIMPVSDRSGFVHSPLALVVRDFLSYVEHPHESLTVDARRCSAKWIVSGNPAWLLRMADIFLALGNTDRARETLTDAARRFPRHEEFARRLHGLSKTT
jgi:hypothetical protein